MNITGITGQSGSGKTTAARIFEKYGFYHIDCDDIVHNDVYTDKFLLGQISAEFGNIYVKDGVLERRLLGKLVFSDGKAYEKLMGLVMPCVTKAVMARIEANAGKMMLLDAPLLFEYKLDGMCSHTVGVVCDNLTRRICERDGISEKQADARLKNQKPHSFYRENCDFIIENNGNLEELEAQISRIASIILKGT